MEMNNARRVVGFFYDDIPFFFFLFFDFAEVSLKVRT